MYVHVPQCARDGERTTLGSQFYHVGLGDELRLSGLETNAFTQCLISASILVHTFS